MKNERHSIIPSVYLIIRNEKGQIPFLLRQNTGFKDGQYCLISGHVEQGESFFVAMLREAKEEVGIDLSPKDLEVDHVMHRLSGNSERVDAFITASKWDGEVLNAEPDKSVKIGWFSEDELPENTMDYVQFALAQIKEGTAYSEYGWK